MTHADEVNSPKLVVVTGPSGVGKSTIVQEALRRTGAAFSVSATTREPRPGEVDGREYRFLDRDTFEQMIADDELLEWAEVYGRYYGTPAEPARRAIRAGRPMVLEIDVQGGLQVAERAPDATFVLILPPDEQELARRLRKRGTEDEASFARRFGEARKEIEAAERSGVYTHKVINDDLERAIGQVVDILNQECRTHDRSPQE